MNVPQQDQLEMQLRALGRRLQGTGPDTLLMERVRSSAHQALIQRTTELAMRRQRHMLTGLCMFIMATLPLPALFLWMDWTAVSSLLSNLLPPSASHVVSCLYLWIKAAALVLVYGIGVPALLWAALCSSRNREWNLEAELAAS